MSHPEGWDAYEHQPPTHAATSVRRRRNRCACGGQIVVLTRDHSISIDQIALAIQLHNETFGHHRWRLAQGLR